MHPREYTRVITDVRSLDHFTKPEHHTSMKFSSCTEFRFGTPKYSRLTSQLTYVGGACFILSWLIG